MPIRMGGELCNQNSTMMQYAKIVLLTLTERWQQFAPYQNVKFAPDYKVFDYYHAGLTANAAVTIEWEQFLKGQRKNRRCLR